MKEFITWIVHTPAGVVAVVAAISALVYAKGSAKHKRYGRVFMIAMLIMLIAGCASAILKKSINDVFLSMIVGYSVLTAWLSVTKMNRRRARLLEYAALGWIVLIGLSAVLIEPIWNFGNDVKPFIIWPIFAVIFMVGDIANLIAGGYSGSARILRHLWRIEFALLWSALAVGDKIVKMRGSTLEESPYVAIVPVLMIAAVFLYWFVTVLVSSKRRPSLF